MNLEAELNKGYFLFRSMCASRGNQSTQSASVSLKASDNLVMKTKQFGPDKSILFIILLGVFAVL